MTDDWSLKRLAWAYGCAKKGSEEEQRLLDALLRRTMEGRCVVERCTECGKVGKKLQRASASRHHQGLHYCGGGSYGKIERAERGER